MFSHDKLPIYWLPMRFSPEEELKNPYGVVKPMPVQEPTRSMPPLTPPQLLENKSQRRRQVPGPRSTQKSINIKIQRRIAATRNPIVCLSPKQFQPPMAAGQQRAQNMTESGWEIHGDLNRSHDWIMSMRLDYTNMLYAMHRIQQKSLYFNVKLIPGKCSADATIYAESHSSSWPGPPYRPLLPKYVTSLSINRDKEFILRCDGLRRAKWVTEALFGRSSRRSDKRWPLPTAQRVDDHE